ncbi:MAG: hypothetical protein SP1CHLAM54_00650 [Chlamydiia bacterium]|nr:hypothetical protein [Chlamydiia bacterium]MCH9614987.1 hypothetical protein [Chlamydiia bacterium]MCH9629963.1 hypothetical protein [Chlamydiia bacterium]
MSPIAHILGQTIHEDALIRSINRMMDPVRKKKLPETLAIELLTMLSQNTFSFKQTEMDCVIYTLENFAFHLGTRSRNLNSKAKQIDELFEKMKLPAAFFLSYQAGTKLG